MEIYRRLLHSRFTKKKTLFFIFALFICSVANAEPKPGYWLGDVNGDSVISIVDITDLVELVLAEGKNDRSDLNEDNRTDRNDILLLIDIYIGKRETKWIEPSDGNINPWENDGEDYGGTLKTKNR